jgi:hypothetical protein
MGGSEHTLRTGCGHHADTHADRAPSPAKSRPWLLSGGKPGYRAGRLHVQIRRAFAANPGQQLPTGVLLAHCYPRLDRYARGHYRHVWRAASKICTCLGRMPNVRGRPNLWQLKTDNLLLKQSSDRA